MIDSKVKYFRSKVMSWHKKNNPDYPWRKTTNYWHAIIAELMLQRTNAEQVIPIYNEFVSDFETPQSYLIHIKNNPKANIFCKLGLSWRQNALNKITGFIFENGIPDSKEELLKIYGIGEYIASAYLSLYKGAREILIDSNIVRLYCRYFGFDYNAETRRKKWLKKLADDITPFNKISDFNYGVLDFSRIQCCPKPDCLKCILKKKCSEWPK